MINNGGFETGNLSGWDTLGDVSVQTVAFGTPPNRGTYQAVLTTFSAPSGPPVPASLSGVGAVSRDEIQPFLGLPNVGGNIPGYYFLEALSKDRREGGATAPHPAISDGSAIRQQFHTNQAGPTLTLHYNFLTDGGWGNANDFAFVTLISDKVLLGFIIAGVESPLHPSNTVLAKETGYQIFSLRVPFAGQYTLGIGVVDMRDGLTKSALCIDRISVR